EVELAEQALELPLHGGEPGEDPALLELARALRRNGVPRVREQEAGDVPELVRELAPLLDRPPAEAHILRRGDLEEAVAGRVGAMLLDRLERVDAGAEALRHAPAVHGQD